MGKVNLIVEEYNTKQVSEDQWRDATTFKTVAVEVPDWIVEGMKNGKCRVTCVAELEGGKDE